MQQQKPCRKLSTLRDVSGQRGTMGVAGATGIGRILTIAGGGFFWFCYLWRACHQGLGVYDWNVLSAGRSMALSMGVCRTPHFKRPL